MAARPCDVVVNAITGAAGLRPTLVALRAGVTLALANKESLVIGGRLVTGAASPGQLIPIDSEHSAILQSLRGGARGEVRRLILTASGGPFRGRSRAELADVTPAQALAHPSWTMGRVITINSATLVNKGLEVLEAALLYQMDLDDITVVVHPSSDVHSMVEFCDGATICQASPPDMRLPIALALGWPEHILTRLPATTGRSRVTGTSSPSTMPFSLRSGWPGAAARPRGQHLRSSMRPTKSASTRSVTEGWASWASSTPSRRSSPSICRAATSPTNS